MNDNGVFVPKHAKDTMNSPTYSGASSYVYPDGRTYGTPYESPEEKAIRKEAQAYGRDNYVGYTALSKVYTQRLQKKRRNKRIAAVISSLLIILLLVGGGFWYYAQQADQALGYSDSSYAKGILDKLSSRKVEDVFYVLLIGSDQYSTENGIRSARSDVMLLARVDTNTDTVTLISIPRDTPWKQESGEYNKINEAYHLGGAASAIEAVEQVTGVKVNHVVEVYIDRLADFIDSIGGLTYNVPVTIHHMDRDAGEDYYIEAGEQLLSGKNAVILMRARHDYEGNQDANRQNTVRGVVEALYRQVLALPSNELPKAVLNAAECVDTDFNSTQIVTVLAGLGSDATFYTVSGPSDGGIDEGSGGRWLCYLNPDGWTRLMDIVDSGEDPSEISYAEDTVYYPSTGEPVIHE